ncbi:MAG: EAL domain-containing protein [Holophaga sp.]|nr:EAL domain-containing protein [Holophaga sp.]
MNENMLQSILSGERQAITYAHPIVALKSGETKAEEMLTRFQGDDGRLRAVGSLLEDLSLSPELRVRLDLLCVGTVFDALARHPITDHLVFVNLSPLTLEHPDFWDRIQAWVWDLPIPPHRIVLELTETSAMHDLDQLEGFARRLRDIGLRVAVDDLGSGVASLSHMARLAPDFIKVDRSLVRDVHRHPYQAALLNALALFAERMRVGYIAEGIETAEELQAVIDADVPWGQGFIFGQPEPLRPPTSA